MNASDFENESVLLVKVGDQHVCRGCISYGELVGATRDDIVELPAPGFYYQCHRCKVWRHCQRDDKDKYRSRVEAAEKGLSVSEVIQLRLLLNEHGYGDITADPHFAETYENFSRRLNAKKVELGPQEPDQWAEYLARKEGA